jgi:putative membrane protein
MSQKSRMEQLPASNQVRVIYALINSTEEAMASSRLISKTLAMVGALALAFPLAFGQTSASAADKKFVHAALQGGMAEVEMGNMAAEHGTSDDVKQFGQKMVADHTDMGNQMKLVAQQIGVTPPDGISPMQKATELKLKALSGDAFDKAYIQSMLKDHREDLKEFKAEAASGQSDLVKDAATKGSTMIAEHLQMIEEIAKTHNIETASK